MGRVVFVTGASSGIGEATVNLFASRGDDVVIHYFTGEERAQRISEEISIKYGVRTLCVGADVSDELAVAKMIDKIILEFGCIDVLVNNAGIAIDSDFMDKTVGNFRRILDVNLIGPFIVSKCVSKYMLKQESGVIVNVGSTNGIDSYYTYSMDYDASKAGLHVLTKDLAIELSPNIRVNAVAPGWTMTEAIKNDLDPGYLKNEERNIVLGRFAEPIEIANVIYFLASDDASYVNGSIIVVDGGRK